MSEFELIDRLRARINGGRKNRLPPGSIGIGDDAAVLGVDAGRQLVVTTDTLVSGVHFPRDAEPADIGHKALAVNLSDLAAMGAEPAWFFLALTLPAADGDWVDAFAAGMGALAVRTEVILAGGDTTSGPLSITITALGTVPVGEALLRGTARAKDLVVVSGTPGLAALALQRLQRKLPVDAAAWEAFARPEPRLQLGQALRRRASACIDISDGLAADLGHIASASQLGAELLLDRLPSAPAMHQLERDQLWDLQLGGGDDYELCFTLPPALERELPALAAAGGTELTIIGRMTAAAGLRYTTPDGTGFAPSRAGYDHFRP